MDGIKAAPADLVCQEYGMAGRDFIHSAISFARERQKRLLRSLNQ